MICFIFRILFLAVLNPVLHASLPNLLHQGIPPAIFTTLFYSLLNDFTGLATAALMDS